MDRRCLVLGLWLPAVNNVRVFFFFPLDKEVSLAGCDALVEKNNGKNLYNRNVSPKKFSA